MSDARRAPRQFHRRRLRRLPLGQISTRQRASDRPGERLRPLGGPEGAVHTADAVEGGQLSAHLGHVVESQLSHGRNGTTCTSDRNTTDLFGETCATKSAPGKIRSGLYTIPRHRPASAGSAHVPATPGPRSVQGARRLGTQAARLLIMVKPSSFGSDGIAESPSGVIYADASPFPFLAFYCNVELTPSGSAKGFSSHSLEPPPSSSVRSAFEERRSSGPPSRQRQCRR